MAAQFLKIIAAALIFSAPLLAQDAQVPEGYESFEAYEIAMYQRIDELAIQRGVAPARFHAIRDRLRAQYDEAQSRNDTADMAEARALQAHLIAASLERLSQ